MQMIAVLAVALLAGGVGLAIAVRTPSEEAPASGKPRPAPPPTQTARPELAHGSDRRVAPMPPGGYKNFPNLPGKEAKPFGTDLKLRAPIPDGGFAAWTGREGMWPGEIEAFASEAKLSLGVALEQRRSTLLQDRTSDPNVLAEILGAPPTGNQLAVINQQASTLHDATANIQVQARQGRLGEDAAIRATRDAEDTYRAAYLKGTGLTEEQWNQLFAPSRPLP
jgi:hypothetical protein